MINNPLRQGDKRDGAMMMRDHIVQHIAACFAVENNKHTRDVLWETLDYVRQQTIDDIGVA
jgi:predicted nucleotidyltransferase